MRWLTAGDQQGRRLARGLGWFSIGLGLTQCATGRKFVGLIGAQPTGDNARLVRLIGLRELACGIGILTKSWPTNWLWGRVAGDAMDLTLLSAALSSKSARHRDWLIAATMAVLGVTVLDLSSAVRLSRQPATRANHSGKDRQMQVRKSITINRTPEEVYRFWRDFEHLPRFMQHLASVQVLGARRSHWKAQAPAGQTVEWDAELLEDRPNQLIAWRSLDDADVANSGRVRFHQAPGGRGTEIVVELQFDPPGGSVGRTVAKLFGKDPEQAISGDLPRLKQILETGEVVRSDASLETTHFAKQRPAQPPERVPELAAASR
jgi:uncharacterized membrane protein